VPVYARGPAQCRWWVKSAIASAMSGSTCSGWTRPDVTSEAMPCMAAAQDAALACRLWHVSEQLTGVRSALQPVP
jgi:hypothetical protein